MIARHVSMRSIGKSDIGALVSYLNNPQSKQERVGVVTVTNCVQENSQDAVFEIQAVQALNTRSKDDKTYHLIISFPPGENPDDNTLKFIESQICQNLGFEEHQRISAVHHDTDNLHIHIAINKIHPKNLTICTPYYDYKILEKVCERLERDLGLQIVNHKPRLTCSQGRANDMEHHAGVESLLNWIKRECSEQIQQAKTWKDLHVILQDNGLQLQEKGNGFVVVDGQGHGVKASSIARNCSKKNLEKRLGPFTSLEPSTESKKTAGMSRLTKTKPEKIGAKPPPRSKGKTPPLSSLSQIKIGNRSSYKKQPVFSRRIDTGPLFAEYQREQKMSVVARRQKLTDLRCERDEKIRNARLEANQKRSLIKFMKGPGANKKMLYTLTSATLNRKISGVKSSFKEERENILRVYSRKTWADWLQAKAKEGRQDALQALQAREKKFKVGKEGLEGEKIIKEGSIPGIKPDNITKAGTIIYRVGSAAIRDDGASFSVTRDANEGGVEAVLRMAVYRYGSKIKVNGSAEFKERIVQVAVKAKINVKFENEDLEKKRLSLKAVEEAYKNLSSAKMREKVGLSKQQAEAAGAFTEDALNEEELNFNQYKERDNEQRGTNAKHEHDRSRGGSDRRSPGDATGKGGRLDGNRSTEHQPGGERLRKPYIKRIGTAPPPSSKNRMRNLSTLGLVQLSNRSEMLLSSNVSGDLEHSRTEHIDELRRAISRPRGITAVDKYIEEREGKRLKGIDIPKHRGYIDSDKGVFAYAGIRFKDGEPLALLKTDENEIVVLSINVSTANRLRRCNLGDTVTIKAGKIKTKGRSL